jgi:uncharacterized SAM-binding protein YcdF (DUF218 family)
MQAAPSKHSENLPVRPKRRWVKFASVLAVVFVFGVYAFRSAGRWLVVQDAVIPADVIVVLSGSMPDRAIEAAHLYKQKAAPEIWISQPVTPADRLAEMQIPFVGEDFYNQKVLLALGVPLPSTRITPQPSTNTEQEIEQINRLTHERNIHTVIIVTSSPHTRRVRMIWNSVIGNSPLLIVRHPDDDRFDADHWWRNSQDALDVVREWLGIANAIAGFPARPKVQ